MSTDNKHLIEVADRVWTRSEAGDLHAARAVSAEDLAAMRDAIAAEGKLLRLDHADRDALDRRDPLYVVGVYRGVVERDQRRREREARAAELRNDSAEDFAAIKRGSAPATWGAQVRAARIRRDGGN